MTCPALLPLGVAAFFLASACDSNAPRGAAANEQPAENARTAPGDVAMIEIDYRFTELYFAGQEQNWPYAKHQSSRLRRALENYPDATSRTETATALAALTQLDSAGDAGNATAFAQTFVALHTACNSCHVAMQVPTFHVDMPRARRSNITRPMNP